LIGKTVKNTPKEAFKNISNKINGLYAILTKTFILKGAFNA
jgi:hypothetical protein